MACGQSEIDNLRDVNGSTLGIESIFSSLPFHIKCTERLPMIKIGFCVVASMMAGDE